MKNLLILLIFFASNCLSSAQESVFETLNTEGSNYELLIIDHLEAWGADTTGQSYILDDNALREILKLVLPFDTIEYRCGGSHNIYLQQGDSILATGSVIVSCGQLKLGGKTYAFTQEQFDYWKSLGNVLEKSHYAFSSLENGRLFYENHLKKDTSIFLTDKFTPEWIYYDGWFTASIVDSLGESYDVLLERAKEKIGSENIKIEYFRYYSDALSVQPKLSFKIYSSHTFYDSFDPMAYGLLDHKGKWKPTKKFEINVFRRQE